MYLPPLVTMILTTYCKDVTDQHTRAYLRERNQQLNETMEHEGGPDELRDSLVVTSAVRNLAKTTVTTSTRIAASAVTAASAVGGNAASAVGRLSAEIGERGQVIRSGLGQVATRERATTLPTQSSGGGSPALDVSPGGSPGLEASAEGTAAGDGAAGASSSAAGLLPRIFARKISPTQPRGGIIWADQAEAAMDAESASSSGYELSSSDGSLLGASLPQLASSVADASEALQDLSRRSASRDSFGEPSTNSAGDAVSTDRDGEVDELEALAATAAVLEKAVEATRLQIAERAQAALRRASNSDRDATLDAVEEGEGGSSDALNRDAEAQTPSVELGELGLLGLGEDAQAEAALEPEMSEVGGAPVKPV